ncbi:hypothetical protein, partial [Mediterraneibacter gnavus]|uniref:hypothetical protein n=1 Tax=Mediterraneibacter gnavus TaxID=33038 RepID=UPI00325B7DE1
IPLFQDLFYYALKMKNKFVIVCLIIRKRGGNDERTSWKNYRFCKRKQNSARVYHLEANLS